MSKLAKYLNQHIYGTVFNIDRVLDAHSTDRSVLKLKPDIVALPSTTDDVRKILRFADQLTARKIPTSVTVRSSGLDKTGACLGKSIVLSMRNMNKIPEVDIRQRLVRCQAGVTLRELNAALALHGLTLPISADPDETIGGLIANAGRDNSAKAPLGIARYVEKAELVLASGDCIQTGDIKKKYLDRIRSKTDTESRLYRNLTNVLSDHVETIQDLLDPIITTPVGYSSVARLLRKDGSFNIAPLLFSSQGTLAVITEIILHCSFLPSPPDYFFAQFANFSSAQEFARKASALQPSALDIYDLSIIEKASISGKVLCPLSSSALDNGYLVTVTLSYLKTHKRKRKSKLRTLSRLATKAVHCVDSVNDSYTSEDFTEIKSLLLAYFNSANKTTRLPLMDGAFVPEDSLGTYRENLKVLEKKYNCELALFGSYLASTYSVRPEINLASVTGRQFVLSFLRDYHKMLDELGGSIAGDAPEGRTKGLITKSTLDPKLTELYAEIKNAFDPHNVLNPGVKINVNLRSTIHGLRTSYDADIIDR